MWVDPSGYMAHDPNAKDIISNNRTEALNEIKQDLGIPKSQHPDSQQMVILRDKNGNPVLDSNKQIVYSREMEYSVNEKFDAQDNPIDTVVVQDHSLGHKYDGGVGDQPPHFNVRPPNNTNTGTVKGLQDHYYFNN